MEISNNAALLGGGVFLSADLASNVSLGSLALLNNYAILGKS